MCSKDPSSKLGNVPKAYLLTSILAILISLAMCICQVVLGDNALCEDSNGQDVECPAIYSRTKVAIAVSFLLFQTWFTIHGVLKMNIFEICGSYAVSLLLTSFAVWKAVDNWNRSFTDLILLFSSMVCLIIQSVSLKWMWKEYRWILYRKVGADIIIRGIFQKYMIFCTLLKFDTMFTFVLIVTSSQVLLSSLNLELMIDILLAITQVVFALMGWRGFKSEIRWVLACFLSLGLVNLTYIGYNYSKAFTDHDLLTDEYKKILTILFLISSIINIVLRISLYIMVAYALKNFGKGFKQFLKKEKAIEKQRKLLEDNIDDEFDSGNESDVHFLTIDPAGELREREFMTIED